MEVPISSDIPFEVLINKEKQSLRELQIEIDQLEIHGFDSRKIFALKEQLEKKKKMLEDFEFQHFESQMDSDDNEEEMEFNIEAAELQYQRSNGCAPGLINNNFRNISPISEKSEDGHDAAEIEDGFESDNAISDEILKSNSSLNDQDKSQFPLISNHNYNSQQVFPYSSSHNHIHQTFPNDKTPKSSYTQIYPHTNIVYSSSNQKYSSTFSNSPHKPNRPNSHNPDYTSKPTVVIPENPFKVPFPPTPKEKKLTFQEFMKETSSNNGNQVLNEFDYMDRNEASDSDVDKESSTRSSSLSEDSKGFHDNNTYGQTTSTVDTKRNNSRSTRPLTRYLPATDPDFDLHQHIIKNGHQIEDERSIQIDSCTCRGYLYKLSGKLRGWQKRWFVFDRKRKLLLYYSNSKSNKSKGFISFSDIIDVFVDHNHKARTGLTKCTFCIETITGRSLFLSANSLKAMRVWIEVIFTGAEGYLSLNPYGSLASLSPDQMEYSAVVSRAKY